MLQRIEGRLPALLTDISIGWKGLPGTNTSSLLKFLNYGQKSLITLAPAANHKTFFSVIYDFCTKLECLLDVAGKACQGQTI